ncbi:MAG: hypothetical protein JW699_06605 [Chitinispirillaceae bacterium]|nr:hypothetical protein [Chitinispirillaceae bacterium]
MGYFRNRIFSAIRKHGLPAGFFALFFVYLSAHIDPRVIYSCNGFDLYHYVHHAGAGDLSKSNIIDHHYYGGHRCILELTPSCFRDVFTLPGGLTGFLTTIVVYACHYPVLGALAVTSIAWLLYLFFPAYVRRCGGPPLFICRYLPALFLLAVCARYELNYLFYLVPILGALTAVIIYQQLSSGSSARQALVFFVLFWLAYWFFQWAALLFTLFVIIHELFSRPKRFVVPGFAAAVNIGLLFVIERYGLSVENSMHMSEFFLPVVPPVIVIACFPLAAVIVSIASAQRPAFLRALPSVVRPLALLCIAAGVVAWSVDDPVLRKTRTVARTLHHLRNGQWERILKESRSPLVAGFPIVKDPLRQFVVHAVNRALCKTGRLGEKMYSYPQESFSPEPLLLLNSTLTYGHAQWAAALDLYLELGLVNLAEKVAGELIECMGPYPQFIYLSALMQIARGDTGAASVYLNRLRAMPHYRREAAGLLDVLDDEAALASDSRIASLRACMDTTDYFLYQTDEESMLRGLLERNPGNRTAYEYLMAYYLQTGQLRKIAEHVSGAVDFGYRRMLPRHWEEALCIHALEDSVTAAMQELPLRGETVATMRRYLKAYAPYENDPRKELLAASELKAGFGATYFYFYTFHVKHGGVR